MTINCFSIGSGVSHTPSTDDEILEGAVNRAKGSFGKSPADLGIGLEGGFASSPYGPILKGWAAVHDGRGTYVGSTPGVLFPEHLWKRVGERRELAQVMDEASGEKDVRSRQGAFGILTRNRIDRAHTFRLALHCAFAPIVNGELYEENDSREGRE